MFELASALFSIADANEFRFARFYIVCEEVALAPLESPLIVCGLSDTPCGLSKRGKDTESDARRDAEEMLRFCSKEPPPASSSRNTLPSCDYFLSLLFAAVFPGCIGVLGIYDSTTASPQGASVRTAPAATGVSVKRSVPAFPVWVTVRGSSE